MLIDKAGKKYWDILWSNENSPDFVNPYKMGLNNYLDRKFHEYFEKTFKNIETKDAELLEIGCASSVWLPYFSKYFGFNVSGLDYSEEGCEKARLILKLEGVNGKIYNCDFSKPPDELIGSFNVVISFGVVEHYENTSDILMKFKNFLREGGILITVIPNLYGIYAFFQKILSKRIYEIHVPLDKNSLIKAHNSTGLKLISCNYFLFINLSIINIEDWEKSIIYKIIKRMRSWLSKLIWLVEKYVLFLRPNRFTSPYMVSVAKRETE